MSKNSLPIIFMMFAIVLISAIAVTVGSYYGSDWVWIAQQNVGLILILITLGLASFTLIGWLKRR